jgi:hypothetical protein
MNLTHPLLPVVAMVVLTTVVWVRLFVERITEMKERRIPPDQIATSRQAAEKLKKIQASDNFKNLFEVPVLFYVLCIAIFMTHQTSAAFTLGLWLFVALRAMHSVIHCTYNNVYHRLTAYLASSLLLFAMWTTFGVALIGQDGT